MRQYFESFSIGSIMDSLSSTTLLAAPMIVPPIIEQACIAEFIERATVKFDGLTSEAEHAIDELTDDDKLVYVNSVIKGKLLESQTLQQQAASNTKEQFANSPDLKAELLNAIMGALDAHTTMSTQALNSAAVRDGMKDLLLDHAALWETLRDRASTSLG